MSGGDETTGVDALLQSLAEQWRLHELHELHAYLLLDRWDDNPFADAIAQIDPDSAETRVAVPAEMFEHRQDRAPCLVPLRMDWCRETTPDPHGMQPHLAQWLAQAWLTTQQRLTPQPFCGVLLAQAGAETIAGHLARLGHQYPMPGAPARGMRYQDPRILQRVWPELSPAQRQLWLGPVHQWWSLAQPWGPWSRGDLTQEDASLFTREPAWFAATQPTSDELWEHMSAQDSGLSSIGLNSLLSPRQWQFAGLRPAGNQVWLRHATQGIDPRRQPDGATMDRLLMEGLRLGFGASNLEDYAWCSWQPDAPEGSREIRWQEPPAAAVLERAMAQLREEPDARFVSLINEATRTAEATED